MSRPRYVPRIELEGPFILAGALVMWVVVFLVVALAGPHGAKSGEVTGMAPVPRYEVVRSYDGDTIRVKRLGRYYVVRIVMIDTPEVFRPNTPIQCWGPQASLYTKALLPAGTLVVLHRDPTLDDIDRYGRLLRYVYKGRINVGYRLVREGYAKVYIYRGQRGIQTERLLLAEARARLEGTGLWGPPCYGDTKKPSP